VSEALCTARELGLASCHDCGLLINVAEGGHDAVCPRCHASVHSRKTNSIRRGWALVLAAAVLYVPANLLPIMTTTSLGSSQSDTIISGIIYLFRHGDWPLAVVVFAASVMVPLLKLVVVSYLLWSVQSGSRARPVDRTRLYRITEGIGRWSMVDIYVVTILVALVRLDALASVTAEMGAVFFGAVVVITIFAAESFDPRLIWDAADPLPAAETGSTLEAAEPEGSMA
jgi:paraquat-inducible protein A